MNHDSYDDNYIRAILNGVKSIAMVGASPVNVRPSYFAFKYLAQRGYDVIPINPGHVGKSLLGKPFVASLLDIDRPVDMVDMFRAAREAPAVVADAIAIGARVLWMQLGIRNDAAAATAEAAGIEVVMNRCPKIEFGRLGGELSWSGVNSGIIRNRPPEPPLARRAKERPAASASPNMVHGFETRAVHAGAAPDPVTGARSTPIYQTAAYVFDDVDHAAGLFNLHNFGYIYARLNNPTVSVLEERVASLEDGRAAVAAASGHAAQFLIFFTLMEPGDEFLASRNLYGGSLTQFGLSFKKLGWKCGFVDPADPENFRRATDARTRCYYAETLPNPKLEVFPIGEVAKIGRELGVPLIVDNTAAPVLCRPLDHGAAIVMHSTTKYIGGHGNSIGGIVVDGGNFDWEKHADRFPMLNQPDPSYHGAVWTQAVKPMGPVAYIIKMRVTLLRDLGAAMSPFNAFLFIQGLETLPLRMRAHSANTLAVCKLLGQHPKVTRVIHPSLMEGEKKRRADAYMKGGLGGLIAVGFLLARTTMTKFTPAQATASIVVSYYWHFVDIVWIALFATIYFIR